MECVGWLLFGISQIAMGCNVREISNIIEDHFKKELLPSCGGVGDKCTFDRNCCRGLECKMSVTRDGVGNYCERRVFFEEEKADIDEGVHWEDYQDSPRSDSDGNLKTGVADKRGIANSEDGPEEDNKGSDPDLDDEEDNEIKKRKGNIEISRLEELRQDERRRLLKENEELERLFTEKDERELEKLKAMKEDAEMDELRRLRELKIKRKLALIKELKELREVKAKDDLEGILMVNSQNKTDELPGNERLGKENITLNNESTGNANAKNESVEDIVEKNEEIKQETSNEVNTTTINSEVKHRQGIHEGKRRRKHHRHEKKLTKEEDEITTTKDAIMSETLNSNGTTSEIKTEEEKAKIENDDIQDQTLETKSENPSEIEEELARNKTSGSDT